MLHLFFDSIAATVDGIIISVPQLRTNNTSKNEIDVEGRYLAKDYNESFRSGMSLLNTCHLLTKLLFILFL